MPVRTPSPPKTISDQLRDAIDACGKSRYLICKEIGLPESTMSHFMHGHCGLQLSTIDRLGKLLKLSIVSEDGPRAAKTTKSKGIKMNRTVI